MTIHTIETLKAWLSDDSQFHEKHPCRRSQNGLDFFGVRKLFKLKTGKEISIQQSALHSCNLGSVEMWVRPHSPLLEHYGSEGNGNPYVRVPLAVVVDYLNEQEKL